MSISLPVSIGEAVDKLSILQLKREYVTDSVKLSEIVKEFDLLFPLVEPYLQKFHDIWLQMIKVNRAICLSSDSIRTLEKSDTTYVETLVWIMEQNDLRFKIKSDLNRLSNSYIREQKSYTHIDPEQGNSSNKNQCPLYICGGRLGDMIHSLFLLKNDHQRTGQKCRLRLVEGLKPHHGKFSRNMQNTYTELIPLIKSQPYIEDFDIYNTERDGSDYIDASLWYLSSGLYRDNWRELVLSPHYQKISQGPWLFRTSLASNLTEHRVIISRKPMPMTQFPWEAIVKGRQCFFATCDLAEYEEFPFKNLVVLVLCENINELVNVIGGADIYIGNQSAPLAIATSLGVPCLAELSYSEDRHHYIGEEKYNPNFYWNCGPYGSHLNGVQRFLGLTNLTCTRGNGIMDRIELYFDGHLPRTCIDVGACLPEWGSNSFLLERKGWTVVCVEPIPNHCSQLRAGGRKRVVEAAAGNSNLAAADFSVVHLNGWDQCQGAISGLKLDDRLIESHRSLLKRTEIIQVPIKTLDLIISEQNLDRVDFVSIDTEGTELDVLRGFDLFRWQPRLLVIENNFADTTIGEYLKQFGYVFAERHSVNDFYVNCRTDSPDKPLARWFGELIPGQQPVDKTLREYFPSYSKRGVMIEIGGYDPIEISNSYHFELSGWDTYCIEANPELIPKFYQVRKNPALCCALADYEADNQSFQVNDRSKASYSALQIDEKLKLKLGVPNLCTREIKVNVRTLNSLLENELRHLLKIDILTIDVEGGELGVLKGFDLQKWKPQLLFVEDHHYDEGKSELSKHIRANGYRLDRKIDYNCFYVPM